MPSRWVALKAHSYQNMSIYVSIIRHSYQWIENTLKDPSVLFMNETMKISMGRSAHVSNDMAIDMIDVIIELNSVSYGLRYRRT